MTREEAVVDYFSKVVGFLLAELHKNKILDEHTVEETIVTIQQGVENIEKGFQKFILDSVR